MLIAITSCVAQLITSEMLRLFSFLSAISLLLIAGCSIEKNERSQNRSFPTTLKNHQYSSEFYHYVNYYHFETDSTGYSEDGQLFWSIGLDTTGRSSALDSVLYEEGDPFDYTIHDSTLTIRYTAPDHPDTDLVRTFYYQSTDKVWISEHEYAYGKEYLQRVSEKVLQRVW